MSDESGGRLQKNLARLLMLSCFIGAAGVAPAGAQTTMISGIEGRVTDQTGGTAPGVTVTISSPALQLRTMTTVTDENGRYRFTALPVGVYAMVFELQGFSTSKRNALEVRFGNVTTIDVKLTLGQVAESVTVTGESPVVDVRTTASTTNLTKDTIATVPTDRSVAELVKLVPGMRGGGLSDSNYGASGTLSHTYDGVQARDTFRYPDVGSLEEVQVRAVANDAEVPTAGVNFVAVVKSGGNEFHGSYLAQWEGAKLQGNNLDANLRAQGITVGSPRELYSDLSADLGGRVLRDRLWFYGGGRWLVQRNKVIGFRGSPGPDGVYFTADDTQGTNTNKSTDRTFKLTGQLTSKQKVNAVYMWEEQRNPQRGAGTYTPGESVGNYVLPNDLKKAEWTYTPTNRSILNFFVANTQWNSISLPWSDKQPGYDTVTLRLSGAYVNSVGTDSTPAGSNSERSIYNGTYTSYTSPASLAATTTSRPASVLNRVVTTSSSGPAGLERADWATTCACTSRMARRIRSCSSTVRSRASTTWTRGASSCVTTG